MRLGARRRTRQAASASSRVFPAAPCEHLHFASEETEASGREVKRFAHNEDPTSQEFFSPSIEKGIERDVNELAKLPQLIKWLLAPGPHPEVLFFPSLYTPFSAFSLRIFEIVL